MLTHRNLLTACFAALLALGLAACGTGGNGAAPVAMMDDPPPVTPDPEPEPDELADVQAAAQAAATAANGFAAAAEADARTAVATVMGRARFQTTPSSYAQAALAREHAGYARDAANNAQTAADDAAAATTITAAALAQGRAQDARASAEAHRGHVTGYHGDAVAAAAMEVFVGEDADGNATYTVGDVTITLDSKDVSRTVGGVTINTGKRGDIVERENTLPPVMEVEPVAEVIGDDNRVTTEAVKEVVGLPMRQADVDIGDMYDSLDDSARLWLVDAYAGTTTVNLFQRTPDAVDIPQDTALTGATGTATHIDHDADPDTPMVLLNAVLGTFLLQEDEDPVTTIIPAATPEPGTAPRAIFSYRPMEPFDHDSNADTPAIMRPVTADDRLTVLDESLVYVEQNADVAAGVTSWVYNQVVVTLGVKFPTESAYKYISYGIWGSLDSKGEKLTELGIGFVNGTAMTEDMPNNGTGRYAGNWVANVQAAADGGDGAITSHSDTASIAADFGKGTVGVTLTGLAALEGAITDNTFSGTKATVMGTPVGGLTGGATVTGTFNGGFFGANAAEAGGVFSFESKDNIDGAFAGAFGGDRTDDDE